MLVHGITDVALPMYFGIWAIIGPKMGRSDTFSCQETDYAFNNSRKDGIFSTDCVDSMLHTLQALALATVSHLVTATWTFYILSEEQILFDDLCIYVKAFMKYVMWDPGRVHRRIKSICAKFYVLFLNY